MNKQPKEFDVLVIGAGAAGLMAANTIAVAGKTVAMIEAQNRIGGRIHTLNDPAFDEPVELGAEFIHGRLPLTFGLLNSAGIKAREVSGEAWTSENKKLSKEESFGSDLEPVIKLLNKLEKDISVNQFLTQYLASPEHKKAADELKSYVESYYAADGAKASCFALRDEWQNSDEEDYRPEGSYQSLLQYFEQELAKKNVFIFLTQPVTEIRWQKGSVQVVCGGNSYKGKGVIITASVGVLQAGSIAFNPALPQVQEAANKLGFGNAIKILLQFSHPFWKVLKTAGGGSLGKLGFLFGDGSVPVWWTQFPASSSLLTGWLGGPLADSFMENGTENKIEKSVEALARLLGVEPHFLQQHLVASHVTSWAQNSFVLGGYSYTAVGDEEGKNMLKRGIENTIYFAGEGLFSGPEIGTVEAALFSGKETAELVLKNGDGTVF